MVRSNPQQSLVLTGLDDVHRDDTEPRFTEWRLMDLRYRNTSMLCSFANNQASAEWRLDCAADAGLRLASAQGLRRPRPHCAAQKRCEASLHAAGTPTAPPTPLNLQANNLCGVFPLPRGYNDVVDIPSSRDGAAMAPIYQVFQVRCVALHRPGCQTQCPIGSRRVVVVSVLHVRMREGLCACAIA
jgi:hypothetical protein